MSEKEKYLEKSIAWIRLRCNEHKNTPLAKMIIYELECLDFLISEYREQ